MHTPCGSNDATATAVVAVAFSVGIIIYIGNAKGCAGRLFCCANIIMIRRGVSCIQIRHNHRVTSNKSMLCCASLVLLI